MSLATFPAASQAASRSTAAASPRFAVNGRFFGQSVTGVQRYAREILLAMDGLLEGAGERGIIVAPAGTPLPICAALDARLMGPLSGHLWEQATLAARCSLPLLSLCNTGPVVRADQVVCLHDANVYLEPASYSRAFRALYRTMWPMLARRAAHIATVSAASARNLSQVLAVPISRISVLYNGHEHVFGWQAKRARVAAALSGGRPFVLLLGSRARHKNAAMVLRLAGALDAMGVDLVVAGGGNGIFAATDTVDYPSIKTLGVVSDDDLAWLYTHAICLAFPSLTEGFGTPLVEAMALGCPVISSDRASMPEVCGGAALMASPVDSEAWLEHFRALLASPALRHDLVGRGREQVRKFSWHDSASGYLDLIRDAA